MNAYRKPCGKDDANLRAKVVIFISTSAGVCHMLTQF